MKNLKKRTGDFISINGPGAAVIRSQTMADVNAAQGAVAGKSWKKTASATGKKTGWPYYYGIQPTRRYPDHPSSDRPLCPCQAVEGNQY